MYIKYIDFTYRNNYIILILCQIEYLCRRAETEEIIKW